MATAEFLQHQAGDRRRVFVVGEGALVHALYAAGFTISETEADFVVVGETKAYNFEMIQRAAQLIGEGARFIATNPDVAGPRGRPSCGAFCAPIERITRQGALLRGQAQRLHDARGPAAPEEPHRRDLDGRRQHGDRHHRGGAGGPRDRPRPHRGEPRGGPRSATPTARPTWCRTPGPSCPCCASTPGPDRAGWYNRRSRRTRRDPEGPRAVPDHPRGGRRRS